MTQTRRPPQGRTSAPRRVDWRPWLAITGGSAVAASVVGIMVAGLAVLGDPGPVRHGDFIVTEVGTTPGWVIALFGLCEGVWLAGVGLLLLAAALTVRGWVLRRR